MRPVRVMAMAIAVLWCSFSPASARADDPKQPASVPPSASGHYDGYLFDSYRQGDIVCDWCPDMTPLRRQWPNEPTVYNFSWPRTIKVNYRTPIGVLIALGGFSSSPGDTFIEPVTAADSIVKLQVALMEVRGPFSLDNIQGLLSEKGVRSATLREMLIYALRNPGVPGHVRLMTLGYTRPIRNYGCGYASLEHQRGTYWLDLRSINSCGPVNRSLMLPLEGSCRFLIVRKR